MSAPGSGKTEMKLSCSTTACPEAPLPEALSFVTRAGFERVELFRDWTESSPVHPEYSVQRVRDQLQEQGVRLSGLSIRSLTGRKADSNERNLTYNLRQVEWDIHLARALGLSSVNIKGGARTPEALDDLIEGCGRLLETVQDITLNLGNKVGNRLESIEDFRSVMPHLDPRAKILLDSGHLLSAGQDVLAFAEEFPERIGVVHLRDQRNHQPVPFGTGDLPFGPLLEILSAAAFTGHLVIEMESITWAEPLEAARKSREFVEALLSNL